MGAACGFVQTIATHDVGRILRIFEDFVDFSFSVISWTPKLPWPTLHWDRFMSAVGPRDLLDLLMPLYL